MSNEMTYADQEEIVYQWLRFRPELTLQEATKAFKAVFAVTLTSSNYSRAKERLAELPPKPIKPKTRYLVALGTLYPLLSVKQVKVKTLMFFGEDTRDDQITHWFKHAVDFPMDRKEATSILTEVEARKAELPKGFDLDTPITQENPDL
jgi:hypothetical protein